MKNNNALFYTCSLIEYIGRITKQRRSVIVKYLGAGTIKRIYKYADIFHQRRRAGSPDFYKSWEECPH